MKVTCELFNSLDRNSQANLIWQEGEFIVNRPYYGFLVSLYSMPGFFSEIYYNSEINQIEKIHADAGIEILEKYLQFIQLTP